MDKPIRDNYLVFGAPLIEEAEIAEVVASMRSGWLGTGPKVPDLKLPSGSTPARNMPWPSIPARRGCISPCWWLASGPATRSSPRR